MSARPLVALTTSFAERAGSHGRPMVVVYDAYVGALERIGLATVLLTPAHAPDSVVALLDACDGLVLSGGGDVDPRYYGEEPRVELDSVLRERDEMEFAALGIAIEWELPILGICRGCQVLNVHLGGTLWQDVGADRPGHAGHPQSGRWEERAHDARIVADSKLAAIVGTPGIRINSFHHQAVRTPAPRLRVTATADDGVIEAVELRDYPFGVAVQWHPERGEAAAPDADPDRRLFAAFRAAVLAHRAVRLARP